MKIYEGKGALDAGRKDGRTERHSPRRLIPRNMGAS